MRYNDVNYPYTPIKSIIPEGWVSWEQDTTKQDKSDKSPRDRAIEAFLKSTDNELELKDVK
jgi:hypothetical protein